MVELRFHGRYGQPVGKVTRAIGKQLMTEGKHVQVFDGFGAFRPGNPMYSTLRVSDEVILERSVNDTTPDIVVVLDNSLFEVADVTKGLKSGGKVMALQVTSEVLSEKAKKIEFLPMDPGFNKDAAPELELLKVLKENHIFGM
ncbi:2-oxoacid:acceptor oxidoreductase family protein [Desulfitobacterium metallireducens]|uniref:Pyruvate oxidoreductase n=1 Tax=Desulfitobacterium metallireducens DSM 15288 TaxID=871968 RepID=W0ED77_9FIRM|nr:2-oxoacid:acceptor oxidoreductase family protein [Desulfitobacterium metallireducens]AHF07036.1 pyruvate oxidoreductase [Desulfitobacterium metallireducens DSM 15288]